MCVSLCVLRTYVRVFKALLLPGLFVGHIDVSTSISAVFHWGLELDTFQENSTDRLVGKSKLPTRKNSSKDTEEQKT